MLHNSCRPNFFIVGAAKCGTTSLANYLSQHPDVYMPELKEPKFFSVPDNRFPHNGNGGMIADAKVVKTQTDYELLFYSAKDYRARGEASVDYLYFQGVPKRIKEYNTCAKIIIILRNPAQRAFSAYLHMIRDGWERLSFEDALEEEARRKALNWEFFWFYKELGLYASQVERYFKCFGPDQVHVILFEDLQKNALKVVQDVFKFLSVDSTFVPDVSIKFNVSGLPRKKWLHNLFNRRNLLKSSIKLFLPKSFRKDLNRRITNKNLEKIRMGTETYKLLAELYQKDVINLQSIIRRDLTTWLPSAHSE